MNEALRELIIAGWAGALGLGTFAVIEALLHDTLLHSCRRVQYFLDMSWIACALATIATILYWVKTQNVIGLCIAAAVALFMGDWVRRIRKRRHH